MSQRKGSDLFHRMQDAALEDLLQTSDEDILKEALEEGVDLIGATAAFRERIALKMAQARRARLVKAREQLNAAKSSPSTSRVRPPFQRLKQVVIDTLRASPTAAVAFRDGQHQTQADWESMYDDLVELGVIKPSNDSH
jgi:hypothetical protein